MSAGLPPTSKSSSASEFMVKVCGITRREDALVAVEAGASAIGFIFFPESPRYVAPSRAAELGAGLGALKVGIFVDENAESIAAIMREAHLDVAQVYGGCAPQGARVWKAFRVSGPFDPSLANGAEAVLLDGARNGSSFDWTLARGAAPRVIIAGGLDASNVAEAIRVVNPWGVDASSLLESSPGIKDHAKVRAFVNAALEAGRAASAGRPRPGRRLAS
jgi:phosphoribosylanthranilate isomerase